MTPNRQRNRCRPSAVVLHHSSGSYEGGVAWICNPASRVSYHCLVARDGRRAVFGAPEDRCWHAGKSSWKGRTDLNSWSIGLSWEGNTYKTKLEEPAIESAIEYLVPIMREHKIPLDLVVTHQQVSPNRKDDISASEAIRFKSRLREALGG